MSLFNVFGTSGTAMNAQNIRLNMIASNIANANTVSDNPDTAYKALNPVFQQQALKNNSVSGVSVVRVERSAQEHPMLYQPDNPMADDKGYVHLSNVNLMEEMANMISASRSYQTNVEVLGTSKSLMMETIRMGD